MSNWSSPAAHRKCRRYDRWRSQMCEPGTCKGCDAIRESQQKKRGAS